MTKFSRRQKCSLLTWGSQKWTWVWCWQQTYIQTCKNRQIWHPEILSDITFWKIMVKRRQIRFVDTLRAPLWYKQLMIRCGGTICVFYLQTITNSNDIVKDALFGTHVHGMTEIAFVEATSSILELLWNSKTIFSLKNDKCLRLKTEENEFVVYVIKKCTIGQWNTELSN